MTRSVLTRPTEAVRLFWLAHLPAEGVAVDATAGNGQDTLYLAEHCRKVYAFDIQEEALKKTAELLKTASLDNVTLIHASHATMAETVREPADVIVFNLGYLPKGDVTITTTAEETVKALEAACGLLKENGLISVIIYHGHPEGRKEKEAVLKWAENLEAHHWHVIWQKMLNQPDEAPEVLLITKKKA